MMTIGKDGAVSFNYDGMKPASYQGAYVHGPAKWTGTISVTGKRGRAGVEDLNARKTLTIVGGFKNASGSRHAIWIFTKVK